MSILSLDPSGNWSAKEGKGTTGYAYFTNEGELITFGTVSAIEYPSITSYWDAVVGLIGNMDVHTIVCEDYKLQAGKAKQQIWSALETPQLLGCLKYIAFKDGVKFVEQSPRDKVRVADPILVHMGVLEERNGRYYCLGRPTVIHARDAIRHGVYFFRYGVKEK